MEVEEEKFTRRTDDLLPLLEKEIHPENYEDVSGPICLVCIGRKRNRVNPLAVFQIYEEEDERGADRLLFSFLTLITKLCQHCGLLELSKPHDTLCRIWGKGDSHTHSPCHLCRRNTHTHTR